MKYKISTLKSSRITATAVLAFLMISIQTSFAYVPRPDHVVICILENHSYSSIIGSASAPYINTLVNQSANLQEYYAITHPSQPNYLMFFSGSNQGETTDNLPHGTPWTTRNLGGSLINAGYSFMGYSENLPSQGSLVAASGNYARKHCPWINWQGSGTNQIPASCNVSSDNFPTNLNNLADVSIVIPNLTDDMHDGSDPSRIATGDTWIRTHLKPYIDWTQSHNSLFILTFDEDDFSPVNHVACIIIGPMVRQGNYYLTGYNHYDMLRTIEDMYSLPYAGSSSTAHSIEEIWMTTTGISNVVTPAFATTVFPNPLSENSQILIDNSRDNGNSEIHLLFYDIAGRLMSDEIIMLMPGRNSYAFRKEGLSKGIYTYQLRNEQSVQGSGKIVVD